jgi:hypothetical protein
VKQRDKALRLILFIFASFNQEKPRETTSSMGCGAGSGVVGVSLFISFGSDA